MILGELFGNELHEGVVEGLLVLLLSLWVCTALGLVYGLLLPGLGQKVTVDLLVSHNILFASLQQLRYPMFLLFKVAQVKPLRKVLLKMLIGP